MPFLYLRLAQEPVSSSTEATPLAADVQIAILEPDPMFPTLVQLARVRRVAPSGPRRRGGPLGEQPPLTGPARVCSGESRDGR
jgi:hypothetical protein